jgi:hypothetical protein
MKSLRRRTTGRRKGKRGPAPQLPLWTQEDPAQRGRPDLLPTSVLLRHRSCPRVLDLIRQVRFFFPELDGLSIRVGLTRSAAGLASRDEPWIWINPRKLTRHTIAHELTHLLQNQGFLPGGEKSADLHALARHSFLVDDLPYYLKSPRSLRLAYGSLGGPIHGLLHQIARESLLRREEGARYYLRWFEDQLEERWPTLAASAGTATAVPLQAGLFGDGLV